MQSLVTVVAEMKAKPGKEEALREAILKLIDPTRKEDGCVQYDLHVSNEDPGHFVFYENWTSAQHLAKHAASDHLKAFAEVRADLLEAPPRVETFSRIA